MQDVQLEVEKQNETEEDYTFVTVLNVANEAHPFVVVLKKEDHNNLGADATPEQLVEASFRFLLDREPVSAIMKEFDISVISDYFPEYESEVKAYLNGTA